MSSDFARIEYRFPHTSVTAAGSLARRAAFLAQRVFPSDLIYVEPVFLGFSLFTSAYKRENTERHGPTKHQRSDVGHQVSPRTQSDGGKKDALKRDMKRREPQPGLILLRVGDPSGHPSRARF